MRIKVTVEQGDALTIETDVLALKYAQGLYGLDKSVVDIFSRHKENLFDSLPEINQYLFIDSRDRMGAKSILFVGVDHLYSFGYKEIREFARRVLVYLFSKTRKTKHVCLTIHGVNYGLDETEAFESEIAGLVDAITLGQFPKTLERITIVERDSARVKRLKKKLSLLLPLEAINIDSDSDRLLTDIAETTSERLRSAGYESNSKPNIFVAMPFDEKMDDIFHYGIQGAVNTAGFLCERADFSSFTGDIVEWVKKRIQSAKLVIADLTNANPNVYLEVGYAWGCGKPTILLVQDTAQLKFDVKGQRCLVYHKIKDLEEALREELKNLRYEFS